MYCCAGVDDIIILFISGFIQHVVDTWQGYDLLDVWGDYDNVITLLMLFYCYLWGVWYGSCVPVVMQLTYFLFILIICLWVTGTVIGCPVNIYDQIGGVGWCQSGVIFCSCCDGGFWSSQDECIPHATTMVPLVVVVNNHY